MKLEKTVEYTTKLKFDIEETLDYMFYSFNAEKVTIFAENKAVEIVTAQQYEEYFDFEMFAETLYDDADSVDADEFIFVAENELTF